MDVSVALRLSRRITFPTFLLQILHCPWDVCQEGLLEKLAKDLPIQGTLLGWLPTDCKQQNSTYLCGQVQRDHGFSGPELAKPR